MTSAISPLTATFASGKVEKAYQDFIFEGDWRSNCQVLYVSLFFYGVYIFLDIITLTNWQGAAIVRGAAVVCCLLLLLIIRTKKFKRLQELATFAVAIILAINLNIIIYFYTSLEDAYYVGLVQECVFVCFLLRMNFVRTATSLAVIVLSFASMMYIKDTQNEFGVQVVVMITMATVCGIGAYLLQKIRRFDFQKTLIIEEQNVQLQELLEDVRLDNTRKLAAINTLVHFVKTPLHQISGYSDIVMNSLSAGGADNAQEQGIEGARYIKEATTNLNNSVNALLTYHRLDEAAGKADYEPVSLSEMLSDLKELAEEHTEIVIKGDAFGLRNREDVLRTAFSRLANFFEENESTRVEVEIIPLGEDGAATLIIDEDGKALSQDEFEEVAKPLTKIDTYLTANGNEMPMALRTAARAFEICGGALRHEERTEGNRFIITMRDFGEPAVSQLQAAS